MLSFSLCPSVLRRVEQRTALLLNVSLKHESISTTFIFACGFVPQLLKTPRPTRDFVFDSLEGIKAGIMFSGCRTASSEPRFKNRVFGESFFFFF